MEFRAIVRDFIPPILPKIIFRIFRNKTFRQRTFRSFDEALKESSSGQGYEDDVLVGTILEKTKRLKEGLEKEPFLTVDNYKANWLLSTVLASVDGKLNILDFGGACGTTYFIFKKAFGEKYAVTWSVVETKNMSTKAKVLENNELKFYDDLQTAAGSMKSIDLIVTSGSLQYLRDPRAVLKEMTGLGARFILFARLSLTRGDHDVISIHESTLSANGPGELPEGIKDRVVKYPHINMMESDFMNIIRQNYSIRLKFDEGTDDPNYIENEPITGYGLLLEKKRTMM